MDFITALLALKHNDKMIRRLAWPDGVVMRLDEKTGNLGLIGRTKLDNSETRFSNPDNFLAKDWVVLKNYAQSIKQKVQ
jgi:hypothetical protein